MDCFCRLFRSFCGWSNMRIILNMQSIFCNSVKSHHLLCGTFRTYDLKKDQQANKKD